MKGNRIVHRAKERKYLENVTRDFFKKNCHARSFSLYLRHFEFRPYNSYTSKYFK